jgi:uncharacterized OB-fold protein
MTEEADVTQMHRPRPQVTEETAPYWDSVAEHAMRLQRCARCGTFRFYPTAVCPACWSPELTWERVSGAATLYSFTVVHKPVTEAFAAETPYVVALVTLEEGPTMMMNLVGAEEDEVAIGMPLRIGYRTLDGFTLPMAEPASDADSRDGLSDDPTV